MIKVPRPPAPPILQKWADAWRDKLLAAKTKTERERAREKYKHQEVKQTLVQMFHGKCAYCESRIRHIDYGHIEHYRPKSGPSGRPDLTFEWTNVLLACGICNGDENKSDHFPESQAGGPIVNPCDDDPDDHFRFLYDPITKLASVYGVTVRGEVTEKLLGMNRPELRHHRSVFVQKLAPNGKTGPFCNGWDATPLGKTGQLRDTFPGWHRESVLPHSLRKRPILPFGASGVGPLR